MRPTKFSLNRRDKIIIVTLGLLVLILGYWRMVPGVCGAFHDDGIYVITAKALAQGEGYRLIYLPHSPIQTKYPILYPALLAVVWKVWPTFPDNLLLMKWLTLLCGTGAVGLFYLYIIRFGYFSRTVAAASALICATSPMFLYYSTQTLSEIPFALLVILALWAYDAQKDAPLQKGTGQFCLGVLLALPFLCRTVGITLVLAALVVQYFRGRPLRWLALGLAVVMVPWFAWMAAGFGGWNHDPITGYYTDYVSWWTAMDLRLTLSVIWQNFLNIVLCSAVICLEGLNALAKSINLWVRLLLVFFLGAIPLVSIVADLRSRRLLPFFIMAYLGLVVLWPWHPMRFLVPLLPFLLCYFFQGLSSFFQRWKISTKYLLPLGIGLLVAANVNLLYQYGKDVQQYCFPHVGLMDEPAAWSDYQEMFRWLKVHSQPGDLIASWDDSMTFLYTGRPAIRPFKINPGLLGYGKDLETYGSAEDLFRTLKAYKVRYLVEVPLYAFDQGSVDGLIDAVRQQHPDSLKQVYSGKDKRFVVFEVPRPN